MENHGAGSLSQQGLDEPFRFAVGYWYVQPCAPWGMRPKAAHAARQSLDRKTLPLSESTCLQVMSWPSNLATARSSKPNVEANGTFDGDMGFLIVLGTAGSQRTITSDPYPTRSK